MDDIYKKYETALSEIERLRQENNELKRQLGLTKFNNTPPPTTESKPMVEPDSDAIPPQLIENIQSNAHPTKLNHFSSVKEKIDLYRSYFRGREDVYPVRWTNKQGKSGYSPVCGNDWTAVCQKPKVKCSACLHQNFLPITDKVIYDHLDAEADRTIGIYPLLQDETCWFLAMDFDKQNWQLDAASVMKICHSLKIPASLERSRSGNGGHVWIFFAEPIVASQARRLGTIILSLTMNDRYQLGLDSYDRLFPNQDTMPKGGFGNLIALPLQGGPRRQGNSVFIDEHFNPYKDQWRFLSEQGKMTENEVMRFIQLYAKEDQLGMAGFDSDPNEGSEPCVHSLNRTNEPIKVPMPVATTLVVANRIYIEKKDLPTVAINRLQRLASFSNPDFYKTQAMRLSTYGKMRTLCFRS